ncbi:MAG: calcium/sodium antiporter [Phascolarctobacterium sp.]|nr:calcium/sodium antiporter [Phascolarctobacterium sp.]
MEVFFNSIYAQFVLLVLGFAMLSYGADWFVEGAAGIAKKFGISQLIVGLTIVAMGTSAPEAAVSISAASKGVADITIGNVVGSNIMNILVILGLAAAILPLPVQISTVKYEMPFMICVSILLFVLGKDGYINFTDGCILAAIFVGYMLYCIIKALKEKQADEEQEEEQNLLKLIVFLIVGMAVVVYGSDITVAAAEKIAKFFGMSDRVVGLTVVALGTSLPELFTSVTAARKGDVDIAIGNIVGSNLFNILFVVGLSAIVIDVPFAKEFTFDSYLTIASAIILWLCVLPTKKLERLAGLGMLAAYCAYVWYII